MAQVHSIPLRPPAAACQATPGRPDPRLRPFVLGYAGFASGTGAPLAHRLLPLSCAVLVVAFDGSFGLVTGPRVTATVDGPTTWGRGVSVGLTPAGVAALCRVPMGELAGQSLDWRDVFGPRVDGLADRLADAPTWPDRFALLDRVLLAGPAPDPSPSLVFAAWQRLQGRRRVRVGALADQFGISRRALELRFRRAVGLSPGAVARVSRFQTALGLLCAGSDLAGAAIGSGYADQPHFTREVRAMAGLTPRDLCAFVQYRPLVDA